LDGIEAALERAARDSVGDSNVAARRPRALKRLWDADWAAARDLVQRLRTSFQPWLACAANAQPQRLQDLVTAHVAVAEALSRPPLNLAPTDAAASERKPLYEGEAGEAAHGILSRLVDPLHRSPMLAPADYPEFYRGLVAGETVRSRAGVHPRLSIWGPLEARLQQPDVVVLGALNEGTWPEIADPGPWLNRPMRSDLGLPSPDERIGRAAHDFTSQLGAERVYLTRALKVDGNPTVPSRWLMRLDALLAGLAITDAMQPDRPWLAWARARDLAAPARPVSAPAPRPPVAARPRQLSVTAIERWLANPYAIYAGHILGLEALPAIGHEPDVALKGSIVHAALGRFTARHPETLPADIQAALEREIADVFADFTGHARIAAFWLPRFTRFAEWYAEYEPGRRDGIARVQAEVTGRLVLAAPAGPFTLTARADRIEQGPDGLGIVDFKTGAAPKLARVVSGAAPQLPLEAAIARAGGFASVAPAAVTRLTYVRASGGTPPGKPSEVKPAEIEPATNRALAGLAALVARFDDVATPYSALRRATFDYANDSFAHLARVAEWMSASDDAADPVEAAP
jgi:ATP-dependent helicase/nuclease subunit B